MTKKEKEDVNNSSLLLGRVSMTSLPNEKKQEDDEDYENLLQELEDMQALIDMMNSQDYIGKLIDDNNAEIAYLKTKQKEQELAIKNRQENAKILEMQRKALKKADKERQKLYNSMNREIGLTKINKPTMNLPVLELTNLNEEPLIKSKQAKLVEQDEKNRLKNEARAELFYRDEEETETKEYFEKKKAKKEQEKQAREIQLKNQIEQKNNSKVLPIADVDKTLFKNGNLAEMDFAKSKELGKKINIFSKNLEKIQKYKKKLPTKEQILQMVAYSVQNSDETKSANMQFEIDLGNGYVWDNAFAINFISNVGVRNYAIGEIGKEAAENLYMAKKEYYMNTPYAKEHTIFNNCYELEPRLKKYFEKKISQQIGPDKLETTKGIYIDANSLSSKKMAKNFDLQKKVSEHLPLLKKGQKIEIDKEMTFRTGNFNYAINNADILDLHINKQGNVDLLVADVYDFNKNESKDLIKLAREHQDRGDLIPYFIIYHVEIPVKKLKK